MLGSEFVFHCVVDLRGLTIVDVIILDAPYKASTSRPIKTFWGVIISDLTIISVVLQKTQIICVMAEALILGYTEGLN